MQDPMRLHIQPDIWADYDPEKAREGLRKSAGALKGVDIEALKKDVKSQRQADVPEASALLSRLATDGIAISIITYVEAFQGVTRSRIRKKHTPNSAPL